MKNFDHLIHGIECMVPFENFEQELIEFACRTTRADDPYEAMLRETFAIHTIITRRMSRQLYEEEVFVTGAVYDMQTKKYEIPKTLTALHRMLRELRAQYRFLNEYVKNPLPPDTPEEDAEHLQETHVQTTNTAANDENSAPSPEADEETKTTGQSAKNSLPNNGIPSKSGTVHSKDRDTAVLPNSSAPPYRELTPPHTIYPELENLLAPGAPAACVRSGPPRDRKWLPQSARPTSNEKMPERRIDAEDEDKRK